MDEQQAPPNHHANYPGFAGLAGLIAALSMTFGRKSDARLVVQLSGMESDDVVETLAVAPVSPFATRPNWVRRSPGSIQRPSWFGSPGSSPGGPQRCGIPKVWRRRSLCLTILLQSCGRSPLSTTGRTSTADFGKYAACLLPGGRLVAVERRAQAGSRGHASHGWTDEQATAFADRCRDPRLHGCAFGANNNGPAIDGQCDSQQPLTLHSAWPNHPARVPHTGWVDIDRPWFSGGIATGSFGVFGSGELQVRKRSQPEADLGWLCLVRSHFPRYCSRFSHRVEETTSCGYTLVVPDDIAGTHRCIWMIRTNASRETTEPKLSLVFQSDLRKSRSRHPDDIGGSHRFLAPTGRIVSSRIG